MNINSCGMIANEASLYHRRFPYKFTTICDHKTFDNEKNQFRIVSYKGHQIDNCKTIQTGILSARFMYKIMRSPPVFGGVPDA